jgi:hypothetical protein
MVAAMSSDSRSNDILWDDFKCYMAGEFAAGRNMLNGNYILPTGQALPFGLTIKRMKRHRLMSKVLAGGMERYDVMKQHEHAMLHDDTVVCSAKRSASASVRIRSHGHPHMRRHKFPCGPSLMGPLHL